MAQLASASGLGPEGPVFESLYPDIKGMILQNHPLFCLYLCKFRVMIIQAKGIEKSFGDLKVLKGIDFEVGKSEVVSIMGASGAGKSTLLQILGTLSTPDAGTALLSLNSPVRSFLPSGTARSVSYSSSITSCLSSLPSKT